MRTGISSLLWAGACIVPLFLGACGEVSDRAPAVGSASDTLRLAPVGGVGLEAEDAIYLFGSVSSVAVDGDGRVFVGDAGDASVRMFGFDGGFIDHLATGGEGPGEIRGVPAGIITAANGSVYVRDQARITVFGVSSSGSYPDSVLATWGLPSLGNLASTRSRLGPDGRYYYPGVELRAGRHFYLPFEGGAPTGDTLQVPGHTTLEARGPAWFRTGPGGGRILQGLNHVPFARLPSWDVTPRGTVVSSDGGPGVIVETALSGDTVALLPVPSSTALAVPEDEWTDSLQALTARIDSVPVPLSEVVNLGEGVADRTLPDTLPAVVAVHASQEGDIWIERWPAEGQPDHRFYDVLDVSGRHLATVVLEAPLVRDPPPYFGHGAIAGIVRDPVTGVEEVIWFRTDSVEGLAEQSAPN